MNIVTDDEDDELQITSEIYDEIGCTDSTDNEKSISKFIFTYPVDHESLLHDDDGDLIIERKRKGCIEIEHQRHTDLTLVGLQVWRGALLLADYILHNRKYFKNKTILELGSGVGLTGIVGGIYAKRVICTDINYGGILELIQRNINRNTKLVCDNSVVDVMELNFKQLNWSDQLKSTINQTDVIIAADVIYDDDLTDAFVSTIQQLLETTWTNDKGTSSSKYILVALEKRYVFTLADFDSLAPCFEYFRQRLDQVAWTNNRKCSLEYIPCDFPQFFEYDRVKELVLMKLSL